MVEFLCGTRPVGLEKPVEAGGSVTESTHAIETGSPIGR